MLQSTKLLLFTVLFLVIGNNQLMAKLIGPPVSIRYTTTSPTTSISTSTITSTTPIPSTTRRTTTTTTTTTTEAPNAYNHPKFHLATEKLNWFGATGYCLERNWKLIVLDSEGTRKEFEHFLTKYKLRKLPFWTAGNQLGDMKTWRWGLDGPKLRYTYWAKGQPDNYNHKQHCLKLFENSLQWDDDFCERAINFVCLKN
ncbi:galactose-specific lectin nattectin isoform X2 [Bactrocera dorsalis]|uniref:Galactose-specific lectin nattectin isoform X2 n=1 Tax=Bactrocera dorsalis TaxID=27457 RepID=A0ABM3JVM8_BACDO|nr:galactose-specific lectin nattectin isoform X2 [Bactrocera dorsalis]